MPNEGQKQITSFSTNTQKQRESKRSDSLITVARPRILIKVGTIIVDVTYLKIPSNGSMNGSQHSSCVLKVEAAMFVTITELIASNRPCAARFIFVIVVLIRGVIWIISKHNKLNFATTSSNRSFTCDRSHKKTQVTYQATHVIEYGGRDSPNLNLY